MIKQPTVIRTVSRRMWLQQTKTHWAHWVGCSFSLTWHPHRYNFPTTGLSRRRRSQSVTWTGYRKSFSYRRRRRRWGCEFSWLAPVHECEGVQCSGYWSGRTLEVNKGGNPPCSPVTRTYVAPRSKGFWEQGRGGIESTCFSRDVQRTQVPRCATYASFGRNTPAEIGVPGFVDNKSWKGRDCWRYETTTQLRWFMAQSCEVPWACCMVGVRESTERAPRGCSLCQYLWPCESERRLFSVGCETLQQRVRQCWLSNCSGSNASRSEGGEAISIQCRWLTWLSSKVLYLKTVASLIFLWMETFVEWKHTARVRLRGRVGGCLSKCHGHSWCILWFSLHTVGVDHTATMVGQVRKRVRLSSIRLCFPREGCCDQEWC